MINLRNIVFGIAIFILTMFVGIYGISTIYGESPTYDDYCPFNLYGDQDSCEAQGGEWVNNTQVVTDERGEVKPVPVGGGSCNFIDPPICQGEYEAAEEKHYRKVFYTALPLGIVVIIIGGFALGLEAVSVGLMLGGVGLIVYGTGAYWRFTDDWLKFLISLAGLIILIWAAYWFNKREKGFWKRFFVKKR